MAERPLANHAPGLTARGAVEHDHHSLLKSVREGLEGSLAEHLRAFLGGVKVSVTVAKIEQVNGTKLRKQVDDKAVSFAVADANGNQLLGSLTLESALSLTDRAFGGDGVIGDKVPSQLPPAAELTMTRFGDTLAVALEGVFGFTTTPSVTRNDTVLRKFAPTASSAAQFWLVRAEIAAEDGGVVPIIFALGEDTVPKLIAAEDGDASRAVPGDRRRPDAAPFGDVPLPLAVPLAEMTLPVSRIYDLKPGDLLPLNLRADVPLRLAGVEIARGQIGTEGTDMALRLTRILWNMRTRQDDQ